MESNISGQIWTAPVEKLARKWRGQIGVRIRGHKDRNRIQTKRFFMLGIPNGILGVIVGFGLLTSIFSCDGEEKCTFSLIAEIAGAILSGISGSLGFLITFLNYGQRAEMHKKSADDFESLYRKIESQLSLTVDLRDPPAEFLKNIRDEYDSIVKDSPTLSEKYNVNLDIKKRAKPPKPEEINIQGDYQDVDTKDLQNIIEDVKNHVVNIQSESELPFDIYAVNDYDQNNAIRALLASKRNKLIEKKLMNDAAYNYHMNRFDDHVNKQGSKNKNILINNNGKRKNSSKENSREISESDTDSYSS
jgi:hypothetical protein